MPEAPALISDLDGTLLDTREANRSAYAQAFAEVGVQFDGAAYDAAFGLAFAGMLESLAPGTPAHLGAAIAAAKRRVYPTYFRLVHVNHALAALLASAKAAGSPLGLVTTARRENVAALLAHVGLGDLFSVTVAAEDVAATKPAPDGYLLAASLLGRAPASCIVFEDSPVGVEAATAAGCAVMKVTM